jgi:hypothetical protein
LSGCDVFFVVVARIVVHFRGEQFVKPAYFDKRDRRRTRFSPGFVAPSPGLETPRFRALLAPPILPSTIFPILHTLTN